MKKVVVLKKATLCQKQILASRDSSTEPCGCNAVVLINNVPYCAVHADEVDPTWEQKLHQPTKHRQPQQACTTYGLGLNTDAAAIDF